MAMFLTDACSNRIRVTAEPDVAERCIAQRTEPLIQVNARIHVTVRVEEEVAEPAETRHHLTGTRHVRCHVLSKDAGLIET